MLRGGRAIALLAVGVALGSRGYELPHSKVKLRGLFWALNWICDAAGLLQSLDVEGLRALHERVLAAESVAFGDDETDATTAAKRELFEIQVAGVDAEGNRFTPLGRALFGKDLVQRLTRRLRLAETLAARPEVRRAKIRAPVVIVGLPRTGSTMLHRLLAIDERSRSPAYWELAHDSDDLSPPPGGVSSDARGAAVQRGFGKLRLLSPNGLVEFFKFHKVDAYEIEEVTGLLRRYFWDLDTALLAPLAVRRRLAWLRVATG